MELRQLECVVAVAEELNFGRAAERLHLGQPAVSQQISRLERELRVTLFDRTSRSVRLTAAGRRFLVEARAVLAAVGRARASVAEADTERLRIGTSSGLGAHLARLLDLLAERAPGCEVTLASAATRERLERVRGAQLDAAFVRGDGVPADLEVLPVWDDELVVALPAGHSLAAAPVVPLGGLAGLPLRIVSRTVNQPLVDLVVGACARAGFEPPRAPAAGRLEDTLATLGVGEPTWAVVYAGQAANLHTPRIAFRPFGGGGLWMRTSLVVMPDVPTRRLTPLLDACVALVAEAPAGLRAPIDHRG